MGKFQERLQNFMRGRYGYDDLARAIFAVAVVVLAIAVVCNILTFVGGNAFYVVGRIANIVGTVVLLYGFFRVFSRNQAARRAENDRYLVKRASVEKKRGRKAAGGAAGKGSRARKEGAFGGEKDAGQQRDEANYKYLTCPHCQQAMRVPRGKGKIAVKCPKCKESTIIES